MSKSNTTPSSKWKYLGTGIVAQTPLFLSAFLAKAEIVEQPIASAVLAAAWLFLSTFAVKVWKEVEEDAVKGAAEIARAAPQKMRDITGRFWDAGIGWLAAWSPGFTRRYLRELRRAYGLFNDKGLGLINANRLDLDKVYVELKASGDVNLNKPNLNPLEREIRGRASFWEHLRAMRTGFALVVIGAPGSGKTTLLQHVLLTYSSNRQWRRKMRGRVPFFLEMRKMSMLLQKDAQPSLPKVIEAILKENLPGLSERFPKGWIDARLHSGRCIMLLDGLDEVADTRQRKRISKWLDNQIAKSASSGLVWIVSARPAGYSATPLQNSHVLEVQPFDFEDTVRFMEQWYHANEVVSHGNKDNADVRLRARQGAQDLRNRLGDNLRLSALTGNPLLLTMVCMVHRYHGALPGSRGQLYAEICQVLLERWRQGKGIADEHRGEQKLEVIRHLASYMMAKQVKELDEHEVNEVMKEPLSLLGVTGDEVTKFLHRLQDQSGLLLELSPQQWSFAHLSFQEFLCADLWTQRQERAPADWRPLVLESWWRETLLLYASKAQDASGVVAAALDAKTIPALVLALLIRHEKPNLTMSVRHRLETAVTESLKSKEPIVFLPAAEALLMRHQETGYHAMDSAQQRQLSGWVSQGEYQLFVLSQKEETRWWYLPLHWRQEWFQGNPEEPITGITTRLAQAYCEWLNRRFPEWSHGLPQESDTEIISSSGSSPRPLLPMTDTGCLRLSSVEPGLLESLSRWLSSSRWPSESRWVLDNYNHLGLARTLGRDLGLAHALRSGLVLGARARAHDRDFNLTVGRALSLAVDPDLALHNRARDSAIEDVRPLASNLDLDFDLDKWDPTEREKVNREMCSPDPVVNRRALCLYHLKQILDARTLLDRRSAWRKFFVATFDSIREYDVKLITNELHQIEWYLRLLVERETGKCSAWEGLLVARQRRT